MGLCPDNDISGGKVLWSGTRKVKNRIAVALRMAAQSLQQSESALGVFYRRMRARLGAPKAITAAARKLALVVYRMLKHGEAFVERGQQAYEEEYAERKIANLRRSAKDLGFQLVAESVS